MNLNLQNIIIVLTKTVSTSDKIPLKRRKQNNSIALPLVLRWTVNQDGRAKDEMD